MSFLWTPRRHNAGFLTIRARRTLLWLFVFEGVVGGAYRLV